MLHVVQQIWLNKRIGSPKLPTRRYNLLSPTFTLSPQAPHPKISSSGIAVLSMLIMTIPDNDLYYAVRRTAKMSERHLSPQQVGFFLP